MPHSGCLETSHPTMNTKLLQSTPYLKSASVSDPAEGRRRPARAIYTRTVPGFLSWLLPSTAALQPISLDQLALAFRDKAPCLFGYREYIILCIAGLVHSPNKTVSEY